MPYMNKEPEMVIMQVAITDTVWFGDNETIRATERMKKKNLKVIKKMLKDNGLKVVMCDR